VANGRSLKAGRTYSWEQLATEFDCDPDYFSSVGGMASRPKQGALLLITHAGGARPNEYGDYWDGDELVYTGRGRRGDQKRNGQNRLLGDNARANFVFEPAGSRQLQFLGEAECVEEWTERDDDVEGKPRDVLRFRLRLGVKPRKRKAKATAQRSAAAAARKPRPFDPDQPPKQPAPASAQADPEATQALREKAVKGHHELLSALTASLQARGWAEIEEIPLAIDLRALMPDGKTRVIFEAKTVRSGSEGPRVRSAIAQLLEYRFLYGEEEDRLCLVCDQAISGRRVPLLEHLGIAVLWADNEGFKAGSGASSALLS
jgi:hypothetical protein